MKVIRTILGVTLNLLSTLVFQFFLIKTTQFNSVADSYYLALTFGLFAGSIFTSMIQYTYQKQIIFNNRINLSTISRVARLTRRSLYTNTLTIILSVLLIQTFTEKKYFTISEVFLICAIGVLQIVATISVILGYSLSHKFSPGFSGVYPSIGSSIALLRPTLATILMGLCAGYVLQILHNFITTSPTWRRTDKCNTENLKNANENEFVMILQYFMLSSSNFLQRILFSSTSGLSVSIFATAEKIAQIGSSVLTTGFNQFTFNSEGKGLLNLSQNQGARKPRDLKYLTTLFVVLSLTILFLRTALAETFSLMSVSILIVDQVSYFLKPMLLTVFFAAVGSLITNKLYSYWFVRMNAIAFIVNAFLTISVLVLLFLFQNLQYTAHAYAVLAFINTSVKLYLWYFLCNPEGRISNVRKAPPELLFILAGFMAMAFITLVSA